MRKWDIWGLAWSRRNIMALMTGFLSLMAVSSATAQELKLSMMPSYTQSRTYANAELNKPITVWGRAWGGTAPYTYSLDCGDGTSIGPATVGNPNEISNLHTYSSIGSKQVTLTVTDSNGATVSGTATVRILLDPTLDERANMAIEKGLLYLYRAQIPYAVQGYPGIYFRYNAGPWGIGEVGAAALAFEENGHLPGNDDERDIYAETVRKALNFVLMREANYYSISGQPNGNPDSNGNGKGICLTNHVYATGYAAMALVLGYPDAAAAKTVTVPAGPLAGTSYYNVVTDIIDQYSYCQGDGGYRGSWAYSMTEPSSRYDGSAQQWPCLLFLAAQEVWGLSTQSWVINNAAYAYDVLQYSGNGSIGYNTPTYYNNQAKSGAALVAWAMAGRQHDSDAVVTKTADYIGSAWLTPTPHPGWTGSVYAMYGLKKGLQLQGLETVTTPTGERNWKNDLTAWLLGDAALTPPQLSAYRSTSNYFGQLSNGSWNGSHHIHGYPLNTATAILVLTSAVTVPLPVAVIADISEQPRNFAFELDGSASHHINPSAQIVSYEWDFDSSNGLWWNTGAAADATGSKPTNPGYALPGIYTVTLRVTDNNPDEAQTDITTNEIVVTDQNAPPVAVPIPPGTPAYSGKIGEVITIDGSHSFDPEGDTIIRYEWDLDGDAQYDDANGAITTVSFSTVYSGQIGLRVTSRDADGLEKSSTNNTFVDVYASPSDLYVTNISSANIVPGDSADMTVTLNNDPNSGQSFTDVVVRFYDDNPFTGGTPVGISYTVNLPIGGSATLTNIHLTNLNGAENVYAYVDANEAIGEWDETNNTAFASVSNQPPTIDLPAPITLEAATGQQTTITAAISDPDGDVMTVIWTINGVIFTANVVPAGGTEDSILVELPLGVNEITAKVNDGIAEPVTDTTQITMVDTIAPTITCDDIEVNTDPGLSTAVVTYTPTASDAVAVAYLVCDPVSGSTFSIGTTTVLGTATDTSGNTTTCTFTVTVSDLELPVVRTQDITIQLDAAGNATITASQIDNGSTDNHDIGSITVAPSAFTGVNLGNNIVTLKVTDTSGNAATGTATVTVIDVTPPVITCEDIAVNTDPGLPSAVVTYAPAATDAVGIASVSSDPASSSAFPVGTTTVTSTATDTSGNTASCTFTVTVTDSEIPIVRTTDITVQLNAAGNGSIAATQVDNGSTDNCGIATMAVAPNTFGIGDVGEQTVTLTITDIHGNVATGTATVTVEDNVPPAVYTQNIIVELDDTGNATITPELVNDGSFDAAGISLFELDKSAFAGEDLGDNTVTLTAFDFNGNSASSTAVVTIVDVTAPEITCDNIEVNSDASLPTAVVTYAPTATDAVGIESVVCNPVSGTAFPVGSTPVTATATDTSGNSASCTFTVTVTDIEAPIVSTQDITVQLDVAGNGSITAAQIDNGSTDNCGIATMTVSPSTFNVANVGANTVTLTVTDIYGNAATGAATVMVEDNVPPVVMTRDITVELDADGNATVTPEMIDNGSNDAAGIATLALDKTSFTGIDIGDNTVTLTASDVNGNVSTGTATVTIIDVTAPEITCENIEVNTDAGLSTAVVTYAPTATDAVGIASVVCNPASGTAFPVGTTSVTATATDTSGNSASCTFTVTVTDIEAPIVRTQNITVQLDAAGLGSITAAQIDNGSTDNCGIASLSITPSAFTVANVGANIVTLIVTDIYGNAAIGTAIVSVEDNVPPVVITQDVTVELGINGATISAEMINNGSSDAAGIAVMTLDITTFGHDAVGIHTVTLTVTDVNGNSAAGTALVTVLDVIPPVISLNGGDMILYVGDTYAELGATASDLSDPNVTVVINAGAVDTETVGAYVVTYDATDASGNVAAQLTRTVRVLPRFAIASACFGDSNLKIGANATVNGGIGSNEKIDIHIDAMINGNVTSTQSSVDVKNQATVNGEITAGGKIDIHSGATVTGTVLANSPAIPLMPLPTISFTAGKTVVTVAKNQVKTLLPGAYSSLTLKQGAVLNLTGGQYVFESIEGDVQSQIIVDAALSGAIINVVNNLELKRLTSVTVTNGNASDLLFQVQGSNVRLGNNGMYKGTYLAPNASIELNDHSELTGAMIGESSHAKTDTILTTVPAIDLLILASVDWGTEEPESKGKGK